MKKKRFCLFALFLLCMSFTSLYAQESTNVAGGTATGTGGTLSYSVGQILYAFQSDTTYSVAQGVQQPFEIQVVTGVEYPEIQLGIVAYPNPTTDYLTLKTDNVDYTNLYYRVFDMKGQLLEEKQVDQHEVKISMQHLVAATYFVQISNNQQTLKNFKIIKN
ncbi:T9SS type A sorting domain-containing protein [Maribellus sediminis]|uniref:T9SS type A sorting domain-containing protein n=1 Tax=Maribellus sediminis TaxID=2696285 RepID=UPI00143214BA|nr:T9SS type A sorting domain-containing protein [Maribellus sediminis]